MKLESLMPPHLDGRDGQSSAVNILFTLEVPQYLFRVQRASLCWIAFRLLMCLMLGGSHAEQAYWRSDLTKGV